MISKKSSISCGLPLACPLRWVGGMLLGARLCTVHMRVQVSRWRLQLIIEYRQLISVLGPGGVLRLGYSWAPAYPVAWPQLAP